VSYNLNGDWYLPEPKQEYGMGTGTLGKMLNRNRNAGKNAESEREILPGNGIEIGTGYYAIGKQ